jgi:hypothetical protein
MRGEEKTITGDMPPRARGIRARWWPTAVRALFARWRAAHVHAFTPPRADDPLALRLTLIGLVIALQNLLELPREVFTAVLGPNLTSLLLVVALAGSLVLLLAGLAKHPPEWRWLRLRPVQAAVLFLTLVAALLGLRAAGIAVAAGFQPPDYPNDGTTLDHYAAQDTSAIRRG